MVNRDSGERTLTSVLRWDKLAQRRKSGSIVFRPGCVTIGVVVWSGWLRQRSEEHTSELQSLMRISYAVLCLKKKNSTPLSIKYTYKKQSTHNTAKPIST